MKKKLTATQTWRRLEKKTGISLVVLKAVDLTRKVEKVRGIQI